MSTRQNSHWYITARDGTVVVWGRDGVSPADGERGWEASAWTSDPRAPGAMFVGGLCVHATASERAAAIAGYLEAHGGDSSIRGSVTGAWLSPGGTTLVVEFDAKDLIKVAVIDAEPLTEVPAGYRALVTLTEDHR